MRWVTRGCLRTAPTLRLHPGTDHTHSLHCPGSRRVGAAQDHRVGSVAARSPGEPRLRPGSPPFLYKMEGQVGLHDLFLQTMLEASRSTRTYLYMSSQNPRVAPIPSGSPPHRWGYVAPFQIFPQCSQETPR